MRKFLSLIALLSCCGFASLCCAAPKGKEVVDLEEAKADPDFAIQGEYLGTVDGQKYGVQVVALSGGKFEAYVLSGGLPGEGWTREQPRVKIQGETKDGATNLSGKDKLAAKITDGKLMLTTADGKQGELPRIERKSPTLDAKPTAAATVLFDGTSAEKWDKPGHLTKDNCLLSEVVTKDGFGDYRLHLEFRCSWMPQARGQGRSNSGVYIHESYEIQVLDSFGLTGESNECGGIYSYKKPLVNMALPPMQWQTYDVDFTAPKYEDGKKVKNARITLVHNGVKIYDDLELEKGTPGRKPEGPAPRGIYLQGHGNKVYYRNIWLEKKN